MTSYKIKYKKPAEKFIKQHRLEGLKFIKAFMEIATDIENCKKYDIKKFQCMKPNFFRLRLGKYRAIFEIRHNEIILLVFDIDSRGDIYK